MCPSLIVSQKTINCLAHTCNVFGLIISFKKTKIMGQDVSDPSNITISNYNLKVVFVGFTITHNLYLDQEINKLSGFRIAAGAIHVKLSKRG